MTTSVTPTGIDLSRMLQHPEMAPFDLIRERMGWSMATIDELEAHTTDTLPDIDIAVSLITSAVANGDHITILTDYDMDGVAAGVMAYAGLAELGANINLVVPHYTGPREITVDKINQAFEQYPDTALIITCDVGINSNDGIDAAHARGAKVIVTDHHIQTVDRCHADAAVNPNSRAAVYSEPDICGAQVMHHVLVNYTRTHAPERLSAIHVLAVFAGIGGLADMMPLRGQTRTLIESTLGLLALALPAVPVYTDADTTRAENPVSKYKVGDWNIEDPQAIKPETSTIASVLPIMGRRSEFIEAINGLSLLLAELIAAGKVRSIVDLDTSFLGFTLTPMFNATRRIEGDMADAFMIFAPSATMASRPDYRAHELITDDLTAVRRRAVATLIANNELRKQMTRDALVNILDSSQPFAPYIWFSDATPGILGLLASNLLSETGMPTIVLNPETLNGSARAPASVDMLTLVNSAGGVNAHGDPLLQASGHHQACGVFVNDEQALQQLHDLIDDAVSALPVPTPAQLHADLHLIDVESLNALTESNYALIAEMSPDMTLPNKAVLLNLIEDLEALEPFGQGFTYPEIKLTFQPKYGSYRLMGRKEEAGELTKGALMRPQDYKHLKITTSHGLDLMWWNSTDRYVELRNATLATVTLNLSAYTFPGGSKPQAVINRIQIHD